ncbi:hypothetical protein [Agrococcus carbonis]|uniref:Uncharacterized protein n=1 Tax=Agrococcus carbonis TaxID=684552 RepID=A0A1H1NSD7_9MICO|nr:hypothetical protein [Agrococcus carbonis]SDS01867.1 hypothetical protein SAMN04489719_1350 [Agrococcus carbonis]
MAGPLRVERDIDAARWLQRALADDASVALAVPPIFDAYARILHPATLSTPTGEADAWGQPVHASREISWAEAAALIGDPVGQPNGWTLWQRRFGEVERTLPDGSTLVDGHVLADGSRIDEPHEGDVPVPLLAALAALLVDEHGDADVLAACWEGSELDADNPGFVFAWSDGERLSRRELHRMQREQQAAHAAAVRAAIDAEVTSAMRAGDVLGLPREQQGRGHVLLRGRLSTFADERWVEAAGLGWRSDRWDRGRTPNALWPVEPAGAPAWFVATELDLDFTLVGGSGHLIGRVLGHPALEAERIRPTDPLLP